MNSSRTLVKILLFCWLAYCDTSSAREKVIEAVYAHVPPIGIHEEGEPPRGIGIELAMYLAEQLKLNYIPVHYPFRRYMKHQSSGLVDFTVTAIYPDAAQFYYISKKPPITMRLNVYSADSKHLIRRREDLAGKTLIKWSEYEFPGAMNDATKKKLGIDFFEAASSLAGLKMLLNKRYQYMMEYDIVMDNLIKEHVPQQNLSHFEFSKLELFVVVNKKLKNGREIMDKIDALIDSDVVRGFVQTKRRQ